MRVYGLTGNIGSGKSEAARRFEARGIPVIEADPIGHALLVPGGAAEEAVRAQFGERVCTNGEIDRAKLGALVFSDPEALQQLNAITRPLLREAIAARCREIKAQGHVAVIVDAAIIGEGGWRDPALTGVIAVTCPRAIRLQRLVESRGMSEQDAATRIDAQTPESVKAALADWVIKNDGTIGELHAQVDHIAEELQHA